MVEIIAAAIGAAGLVGAAYVGTLLTAKLSTATKRADANTARTDAVTDTMWELIDSLRADKNRLEKRNAKLERELRMCHDQKERR